MDISRLVDKQLIAYNTRNIDELLKTYSKFIEFRKFENNELLLFGHEEVRKFHLENTFRKESLRVEILNRIVIGNYVFDHEVVEGLVSNRIVEAICIYKIIGSEICKIWIQNIVFKTE